MRNRAQINCNPGNLKFVGQKEATGYDDAGFAVFPVWEAGWRALHTQIDLDATRGLNITEFISKYAPPSENETQDYIDFICEHTRCGPFTLLKELSKFALAGVMAKMEGAFEET